MAKIHYNNKDYFSSESETVLDCLLKNDVDYPYSCKSGTCQSCLTKVTEGQVNPESQAGLKPTLVAQNYILACKCIPQSTIKIALPNQDNVSIPARIMALNKLNHNVLQVKIIMDDYSPFRGGQYINLVAPDNLIRSYSIANVPTHDRYLELHVKLMENGLMSQWLSQSAEIDANVYIRGPMGNCFYYNPNKDSFPIVLAGTGTGLAPLIAICEDALSQQHPGDIFLIHGGVDDSDLYLHQRLQALQKTHGNFHYLPCVLNPSQIAPQTAIDSVLVKTLNGIADKTRLFICGPEAITHKMKTKAFLAGVPSAFIYSDAFITSHKKTQ